jgi:hypothetical protein
VKYLGIETEKERHYLFSRPETYGCDVLQDVTKAQVIAKLDEILARGELS